MINGNQRAEVIEIWKDVLGLQDVDMDRPFADLGGTSLMANRLVAQLGERLGVRVPVLRIFEYPTLRRFLQFLQEGEQATQGADQPLRRRRAAAGQPGTVRTDHDIAVVGMACRFPGAKNLEQFWQNLLDGVDSIREVSEEELSPAVPPELRRDPRYVRACGLIDEPTALDAEFFGISAMEARLADPQQRLLLELSWHALEHAGEVPSEVGPRTAVYAGTEDNSYYKREILPFPKAEEQAGRFAVMTANEKDYVAMRIAHRLNLKGPAISVHTACSTSLVAVIMACKSLRQHECDVALAGGASIHFPTPEGRYFQEGGVFSPDGRTRAFDKDAQGTNFTDGAAMVVLKRLEDALRDGNTIFAVIKGVAINSDGGDKVSFSAPSVAGQASCIRAALADADVDPGTIQYLEAHGTATPVGDPIEVEALRQAFAQRSDPARLQYCGIGSVKTNIGHTTAAAGVAGLIKAALALHRGVIPATIHFRQPNPALDIENSPFYVVAEKTDWSRGEHPRRAGVSSFGIGGTNSHVVLEEALSAPGGMERIDRPTEIWPVSARSNSQRDTMLDTLGQEQQWPRDIAYTLQYGRARFPHRGARVRLVHLSVKDILVQPEHPALGSPGLVFTFPGQGAQYIGMGRSLYESIPEFREHFSRSCDLISAEMGLDFREFLFDPANQERLEDTRFTQPAMFAIEVAIGRTLLDWGMEPRYMVGHSIGEIAAAHLAGVFSLEDAARLICARGRLMSELPRGHMLSVRGDHEEIRRAAGEPVDVASVNSPVHCVLAGEKDLVERVRSRLEAAGFSCRLLHTSHAFHSDMMTPVVEPFSRIVKEMNLSAPERTIISSVTGMPLSAEEATDPMYWANHLRMTVRFSDAMLKVLELGGNVLLECGPRTTLTTLGVQHFAKAGLEPGAAVAISILSDDPGPEAELGGFGTALARLWCAGVELPWRRIWGEGRRVPLVTRYPFNRTSYVFSDGRTPEAARPPVPVAAPPSSPAAPAPAVVSAADARAGILARLERLFSEHAGYSIEASSASFVELGFDSLVLVQIGVELGRQFGVQVSLRDLMERFNSLPLLAEHLVSSGVAMPAPVTGPAPAATAAPGSPAPSAVASQTLVAPATDQRAAVIAMLEKLFSEHAGYSIVASPASFVEQGFDSLVLVQIGAQLGRTFGMSIPLRDLMERFNTLPALADHILATAPPAALPAAGTAAASVAGVGTSPAQSTHIAASVHHQPVMQVVAGDEEIRRLSEEIRELRSILGQQLGLLRQLVPAAAPEREHDPLPVKGPPAKAANGNGRDADSKEPTLLRARHAVAPEAGAFRAADAPAPTWLRFDPESRRYRVVGK